MPGLPPGRRRLRLRRDPLPHEDANLRAAESFVETADLTAYDLPHFKPVRFELERKAVRVNMRLPQPLPAAIKARAQARGIPYQRFIREALEQAVARE